MLSGGVSSPAFRFYPPEELTPEQYWPQKTWIDQLGKQIHIFRVGRPWQPVAVTTIDQFGGGPNVTYRAGGLEPSLVTLTFWK